MNRETDTNANKTRAATWPLHGGGTVTIVAYDSTDPEKAAEAVAELSAQMFGGEPAKRVGLKIVDRSGRVAECTATLPDSFIDAAQSMDLA